MCFRCETRGDGVIWYKNPANYGRRIYKRRPRGQKPVLTAEREWEYESDYNHAVMRASMAKAEDDMEQYAQRLKEANEIWGKSDGPCQPVPLKECFEIVDTMTPITKLNCMCRKYQYAEEEDSSNFSCMGMGQAQYKWERWPERYRNGVVFMSPKEAKDWLTYWDKKGMIHLVMPYWGQIAGLCNCDYPGCWPLRHHLDYGLKNAVIKGEYVARVDLDLCNGCGICTKRCMFGAVQQEITRGKANIDMKRCYGCGLCQTGCKRGAVSLVRRIEIPGLKEDW